MPDTRMKYLVVAVFAAALMVSPAHAVEFYKASIEAIDGTGSSASGSAVIIYDDQANELTYDISITGLGNDELAAHIHTADGTIAHFLPAGPEKNGVWQGLGFGEIFQLREGMLYILVHTEGNPGGEVRGEIIVGKVPVESLSVGKVKLRFSAD